MNRKITYLVKLLDEVLKEVLSHTKDIRTQALLLKNKQTLIESLDKLDKKYDNIIKELENEIAAGAADEE